MITTTAEIEKELRELGNPSDATHAQRYFKTGKGEYAEGDKFLGVRVPVIRKLVRKYKKVSRPEVVILLKSAWHEERLFALLMLVALFSKADEEDQSAIYEIYLNHTEFINNWDLVDGSAHYIVGAYLENRDKQILDVLARSKNLWERRIAIMATFYFIKNNRFADTLRIAEILLSDKEDLIHKAVGWMLREIGKRDIETEERFLRKHLESLPRTTLRYAIEKFPEEKRKAYLSGAV